MPTFEITAPDGKAYHVEGDNQEGAVNALHQMLGGTGTAAAAPAAPVAEQPSMLQTIREAIHAPTRALENGALLGLGDRARALIDVAATGGGQGYGSSLKSEQGETEDFRNAHPVAAPALEAVGGAIAPLAVVKAAAAPATMLGKTLVGAGTGGAIGGVQGALGSKDWTDPTQVLKDTAVGGGTGLVLGGILPGASKIIGSGYEKVANAFSGGVDGMSRAAGGHLVKAVTADGPAAVQARLAELGPDAMLADAGPALLGKTQGASLNSDEGRSVLQTALATRDKATNARIQSDVNGALGPAEDPQTVTDAIKVHRSAVDSVNYPAALDNAPSIKIAPIMTDLIDRIDQTPVGSMEHKALTNLQSMLTKTEKRPLLDAQGIQQYDGLGRAKWQEVPVSHDDANVLHKVKGELDNVIQYDAPGLGVPAGALTRQQGALKQMRGAINDALETQVPGYAAANDVSAALAKRGEAVNLGTQYLGSGKTTASPDRFAGAFEPLQPGEKIAFAKGSRGNIERALGTKANDLQALRTELQGEGGWNTAKLATVHGQDAADALTNSVDRNLKFRDTHNKVVENSQTAQRTAAQKAMKPDPSSETALINPNMSMTGLLATGAKKGVSAVANALLKNDPTRSYGEVARVLSSQGPQRDAHLANIVDAINSRQGNAAVAPQVGNSGAVVAALLANAALHGGPMRKRQAP